MNLEEILIKLGFDNTALAKGLRSANAQLEQFGVTGDKGFAHAGSSAKKFHKILEEITNSSPLLGTALTAALNPVVGILVAVGLGIQWVTKQIDSLNQAIAKITETSVRSEEEIRSARRETQTGLRDMDREFKKWVDSHHEGTRKILDDVEAQKDAAESHAALQKALLEDEKRRRLQTVTEGIASGRINPLQAATMQHEIELDIARRSHGADQTSVNTQAGAIRTASVIVAGQLVHSGMAVEAAREAAKAIAREQGALIATARGRMPMLQYKLDEAKQRETEANEAMARNIAISMAISDPIARNIAIRMATGSQSTVTGLRLDRQTAQANLELQRSAIDIAKDKIAQAKDALAKDQAEHDKLTDANRELVKQTKKAAEKQELLRKSPLGIAESQAGAVLLGAQHEVSERYKSTLEELASAGPIGYQRFFRGVGPIWSENTIEARQAMQAESLAHQANLYGNTSLRDRYGSIATALRADLVRRGVLKADPMATLLALAEGKGINVNPAMK